MIVQDYREFDFSSKHVCGVLVQYPNTDGQVNDYTKMIEKAHDNKVCVFVCVCVCACVYACVCVCVCKITRQTYCCVHYYFYRSPW